MPFDAQALASRVDVPKAPGNAYLGIYCGILWL